MKKVRASWFLILALVAIFNSENVVFSQTQRVDFSDVKAGSFQKDKTIELVDLEKAALKMTFAEKDKKIVLSDQTPSKNSMSDSDLSTISPEAQRESSQQFVESLDPKYNSLLDYKHISRFDSDPAPENSINVVPAPGSIILTAIGVSIIGWFRRRNVLK